MGKKLLYRIIKQLWEVDIQALEDKNINLIRDKANLAKNIQNLKNQLDKKEKLIDGYNINSDSLKAKYEALKENYEQVLSENKNLKKQLTELEQQISKLKNEKELIIQKRKEETDQIHTLQSKIQIITTEKSESREYFQKEISLLLASNDKLTKDNSKLKEEFKEYEKQIQEKQAQLTSFQTSSTTQNELIRELKEIISQLQSDTKQNSAKDEIIDELRKSVERSNELTANLQSDIERFRNETVQKEEVELTHTVSSTNIWQKVDGAVIVHKTKNIGKRTEKQFTHEENSFEYLGEFLFNLNTYNQIDSTKLPDVFYPRKGTPVLKWHEVKSNSTVGVTEPLLLEALKLLIEYLPDIEILQNIALAIKNRTYSYVPDIALYWAEFNLCIDIEIDEPYDIISRKPLHYQGSSDYLRNLYFVRQGWVVIRISEEQIVRNINFCVKYIAAVIYDIINDQRLKEFVEDFVVEQQPRWTYDEALELAKSNYREEYLNIEAVQELTELGTYDEKQFIGNPPAEDILPGEAYANLESQLTQIRNRYIRITCYPFEEQTIMENFFCEKHEYKLGLSGFDVVNEKSTFIPFEKVISLVGIDNQFKYPLYNNSGNTTEAKLNELVKEAIYNYNPIRIEYSDANSNITFRNITLVSYVSDSVEYYGDKIWKNYYQNEKGSKLVAFCNLRNAQRHFYIHRIRAIQIFDVKEMCIGQINSLPTALWYPLMQQDFKLCNHILKLTPSFLMEKKSLLFDTYFKNLTLITVGNYAHYLLLSGQTDKSIEIYRKFDGERVDESKSWREKNLEDFRELSKIGNYHEKFEEAKKQLQWEFTEV